MINTTYEHRSNAAPNVSRLHVVLFFSWDKKQLLKLFVPCEDHFICLTIFIDNLTLQNSFVACVLKQYFPVNDFIHKILENDIDMVRRY